MGSIPEFKRTIRGPRVDFGAINRAGSIGRSISQFGQAVQQGMDKRQKIEDDNYLNTKMLDIDEGYSGVFQKHTEENKQKPLESTEKLQESINEFKQGLFDDAPSDGARRRAELISGGLDRKYLNQGRQWELKTQIQNTGLAAQQNAGKLEGKSYREGFGTLDTRLNEMNVIMSPLKEVADNVVSEKAIEKGRQQVAFSAFQGSLDRGDVDQAEAVLNSKKYDEILGSDNIHRINQRILQRKKSLAAEKNKIGANKFKKPYKFVGQMGEDVEEIDYRGEDIENQFEKRLVFQEEMNKKYDMELPLLSENEILQFQASMNKGSLEERALLLGAMSNKLPEDAFSKFGREVFKKDPVIGTALGVARDNPDTARDLLFGNQLLKQRAYAIDTKEVGIAASQYLGNAIPDPVLRRQMLESVGALYANDAYKEQIPKEEFSQELVITSTEKLLGPVVNLNGVQTLSFKDPNGEYLDEDDFEDTVDDLSLDRIRKTHGQVPLDAKGREIPWEDFEDYGSLEVTGDGLYKMNIDINGNQEVVKDKDGKDFILDMKAITIEYGVNRGFLSELFKK